MKKLNLKIYLLAILTLTFVSCDIFGGFEKEEVPITLIFDAPLEDGKYPSYFKDFILPFSNESCEKDFLLKPISFVRADIKRSEMTSNAWYFEDIGENTIEFSTNFLNQYFTDSLTTGYLTSETKNRKLDIRSYLKNEDEVVLIYSEESSLDEYLGAPVYNTSSKIQEKIKEASCNNSTKISIIINPQELLGETLPPDGGGVTSPSPPPSGSENPCQTSTVADGLDLKDDLLQLIDTARKPSERDQLARAVWEKYFDSQAAVSYYLKGNKKYPEGMFESGDGANYFIDRLAAMSSITDVNITRVEYHRETKKISGIVIVECHNASEIQ